MFQITQAAVNEARGPGRGPAADVTFIDKQHFQPATAASRAMPAPLIPAPIMITSYSESNAGFYCSCYFV